MNAPQEEQAREGSRVADRRASSEGARLPPEGEQRMVPIDQVRGGR
jgi:hypothetical protein